MHELALIESMIDIVLEEMPRHSLTQVESITLRIGEMRQYVPEALNFGFECLSKDTPLEGAKLFIEKVPTKGYCALCDKNFTLRNFFDKCPTCKETISQIISGKELELVSFEGS